MPDPPGATDKHLRLSEIPQAVIHTVAEKVHHLGDSILGRLHDHGSQAENPATAAEISRRSEAVDETGAANTPVDQTMPGKGQAEEPIEREKENATETPDERGGNQVQSASVDLESSSDSDDDLPTLADRMSSAQSTSGQGGLSTEDGPLTAEHLVNALQAAQDGHIPDGGAAIDEPDRPEGVPRGLRFSNTEIRHGIAIGPITDLLQSLYDPVLLQEVNLILDRNKTPQSYFRVDTRINGHYEQDLAEHEKEEQKKIEEEKTKQQAVAVGMENNNETREDREDGPTVTVIADIHHPQAESSHNAEAGPSNSTPSTHWDRLDKDGRFGLVDQKKSQPSPVCREIRIDIHSLHPAALYHLEAFRRRVLKETPLEVSFMDYIRTKSLQPQTPPPEPEPEVIAPTQPRKTKAERDAEKAAEREEQIKARDDLVRAMAEEEKNEPLDDDGKDDAYDPIDEARRKRHARARGMGSEDEDAVYERLQRPSGRRRPKGTPASGRRSRRDAEIVDLNTQSEGEEAQTPVPRKRGRPRKDQNGGNEHRKHVQPPRDTNEPRRKPGRPPKQKSVDTPRARGRNREGKGSVLENLSEDEESSESDKDYEEVDQSDAVEGLSTRQTRRRAASTVSLIVPSPRASPVQERTKKSRRDVPETPTLASNSQRKRARPESVGEASNGPAKRQTRQTRQQSKNDSGSEQERETAMKTRAHDRRGVQSDVSKKRKVPLAPRGAASKRGRGGRSKPATRHASAQDPFTEEPADPGPSRNLRTARSRVAISEIDSNETVGREAEETPTRPRRAKSNVTPTPRRTVLTRSLDKLRTTRLQARAAVRPVDSQLPRTPAPATSFRSVKTPMATRVEEKTPKTATKQRVKIENQATNYLDGRNLRVGRFEIEVEMPPISAATKRRYKCRQLATLPSSAQRDEPYEGLEEGHGPLQSSEFDPLEDADERLLNAASQQVVEDESLIESSPVREQGDDHSKGKGKQRSSQLVAGEDDEITVDFESEDGYGRSRATEEPSIEIGSVEMTSSVTVTAKIENEDDYMERFQFLDN